MGLLQLNSLVDHIAFLMPKGNPFVTMAITAKITHAKKLKQAKMERSLMKM